MRYGLILGLLVFLGAAPRPHFVPRPVFDEWVCATGFSVHPAANWTADGCVDDSPVPEPVSPAHETGALNSWPLPPKIVIEPVPTKPTTLTRLSGPRHPGPHPGCMMCLGNHLMSCHGISSARMNELGYGRWQVLHDNCHNVPRFKGHKIRYSSPQKSSGFRLFRRWR